MSQIQSISKRSISLNNMKGLSFSWKRAVGISGIKAKVAHKVGLPTTRQGLQRKVGQAVLSAITGKRRKK
ncbi:MAG: hypothetical protein II825_07345 [Paludibacteraceae bacterium]|nr:hypothetical protein [Paludibacteraceae bacterium]